MWLTPTNLGYVYCAQNYSRGRLGGVDGMRKCRVGSSGSRGASYSPFLRPHIIF